MLNDLLAAIRGLRKAPSFTLVAVGVLALGIGTAAAVFAVVDGVVLRGLPFDDPGRVIAVVERDTRAADTLGGGLTSAPTFLDWRRYQTSFEHLAAVGNVSFRTRTSIGEPVDALAQSVTWEFFPVLRVAPVLGRAFVADDEVLGRHRVVILGHAYWQQQFGGAPDVVGRTLDLNEEPWQIVGVAPAGFTYPVGAARPTDLYVPLAFSDAERSRNSGRAYFYGAIGRLKPGVSVAQADREMARLAAALDRQHPGLVARPHRGRGDAAGTARGQGAPVDAAAAVRGRPGAARRVRQHGRAHAHADDDGPRRPVCPRGTRGVAVAARARPADPGARALARPALQPASRWLTAWCASWRRGFRSACRASPPSSSTGGSSRSPSGRGASSAVACGLIPGLVATRPGARVLLAAGGRSTTPGTGGRRLRSVLVVAEIGLTMLLLVGAGLFARSFVSLMRVDPGFDSSGVIALAVGAPADPRSPAGPAGRPAGAAIEQAIDAVRRVPGVQAAGAVSGGLPLTGNWSRSSVELPGRGELPGAENMIDVRRVSPDYLKVLRVPLLRGRHLTTFDRASAPLVVLVNDAAARKYWPGQDALGQRITVADKERIVVGVVGNIRHLGPETPPRQEAYVPMAQERVQAATLVARTTRPALEILPEVKAAIRSVNPDQRFRSDVTTLDGYLDRLIGQRRFLMALTGMLGLLGLVIATAGVYGVMAYAVAQQTAEIGLRMALGATPGRVLRTVLRQAAGVIAAGVAIGGAGAWWLGASVRAFLFGVQPDDVGVYVAAAAGLALAGLLASAVPARRAAVVDPLVALRQE